MNAVEGANANFSCGGPGVTLWTHNGQPVTYSSGNLILKNVTCKDSGRYRCQQPSRELYFNLRVVDELVILDKTNQTPADKCLKYKFSPEVNNFLFCLNILLFIFNAVVIARHKGLF